MGANVSKTEEEITNRISNKLSQVGASSATANCRIKTGDIILRRAKYTTVSNVNRCTATAKVAMGAISDALADLYKESSLEQATGLLPGVNVNDSKSKIKNVIENELEQKCEAGSSITNEIATGNIILEDVEYSNIKNINTGHAQSNCAIRATLETVNKVMKKDKVGQEGADPLEDIGNIVGEFGDIFGGLGMAAAAVPVSSSSSISLLSLCCIVIIGMIFFMNSAN